MNFVKTGLLLAALTALFGAVGYLIGGQTGIVIAHAIAHIKNRDTLTMTVAATVAGAISSIAQFGFLFGGRGDNRPHPVMGRAMMILAPLAAMIIQMAISRSREYVADRLGAEIAGEPLALAQALAKIDNAAHQIPNEQAESHPATA